MKSEKLEEATIMALQGKLLNERLDKKDIPYGVQYGFDVIIDIFGIDRGKDYFGAGGTVRFDEDENVNYEKLNRVLNNDDAKEYIDLKSRQNGGPSIQEFRDFLEANKDMPFYLEGYVVVPEREDYRLTIDGIGVDAKNTEAVERLRNWIDNSKTFDKPDEYDEFDGNVFRAWWD